MGNLRIRLPHLALHVVLIAGAAIFVFPFLWMLSTSVKALQDVFEVNIHLIPKIWEWQNYAEVLKLIPFVRMYLNTAITAGFRVLGEVFFSAMAGYALARIRFPGQNVIVVAILAVLMIPPQITLIPNYILVKNLGWLDTYQGIIVPRLYSAFGTFLFRQFFLSLPTDLVDAAKVDGCNPFATFWYIALPLASSTMVSFGFLSLLYAWNDFLWPLIVIQSSKMNVVAVGLMFFQNQDTMNFPLTMAASAMAILPMLIIFMIAQRYIVEGITMTGLKM